MSSKRYLLVSSLLALICSLAAQSNYYSASDLFWHDGNPSSWGMKQYTGAYFPLDDESYIELTNSLNWQTPRIENRKQKLNDRLCVGYYFQGKALDYGLSYNAQLYRGSEAMRINYEYVNDVPDILYDREFRHQANIDASYEYSIARLDGDLNLMLLNTTSSQLGGDPIAGVDEQLLDAYSRAELALNPLPDLRVHAAYDYKRHPMDEAMTGRTIDFDYKSMELGIAYDKSYNLNTHLSISSTWQKRDWDAMMEEQKNQVITELRFGHHITPYLHGFCSYINRSCFSDPSQDIYLLSNYARAQLQYCFPADSSSNSYLLVGAKLRPANDTAFHPDTSAYFAQVNYAITMSLYLGAGINIAPEIQDEYSGRISFQLDPNNEIHLEYRGRQSQRKGAMDTALHSGIAIGTEVQF